MTQQAPPKIEFPCQYSIRVMGDKSPTFSDEVVAIIQRHAPELKPETATRKDSSKGRFMSVKVMIIATGEPQLTAIHNDLKAHPAVKMVL
ncbi:MAG: DUF493 domain-containing protein [Pseudomonadales bacterium]|nr:DUF493 domain-containing protein [Pseudomonadales bacterium]